MQHPLYLIGYASGIAGASCHTGEGPLVIQKSPFLLNMNLPLQWKKIIQPLQQQSLLRDDEMIRQVCLELAHEVAELVRYKQRFSIMGGDHTSAIGTWSGVYDTLHDQGNIGLVWIDAHMDSHTPETTESGHIHGMPLASLMGYGYGTLTSILHDAPKLQPENVCLIGVRSFERGEAELLKRLNVRVYFIEEVKERGFIPVLQEAVQQVSRHTIGYGISLDLDSIDPSEAPGVDVPEKNGLSASEVCEGLLQVMSDPKLIGTEIVEFDPTRDKAHLTEKLIANLIKIIANNDKL